MHAIIRIYFFSNKASAKTSANFPEIHKGKKTSKKKQKKTLQVKIWVQNKTRYNDVNIQTQVKKQTTKTKQNVN